MEIAIDRVNKWIALNNPDRTLFLDSLGLTQLPPIPTNCNSLTCAGNQLTSLPDLYCQELYCFDNKLTALGQLPNCLYLSCNNNLLTSLPELSNCTQLHCYNNKLTHLPRLPKCWYLSCDENNLTYLPKLAKHAFCCQCSENKYLYINKNQAQKLNLKETPNYNKSAIIIQKIYKKYLRNRYQQILNNHLFTGPSKLISLYLIS